MGSSPVDLLQGWEIYYSLLLLNKKLQAVSDCRGNKNQFFPELLPLLGYIIPVDSPKHMYIRALDILSRIYTYIIIITYYVICLIYITNIYIIYNAICIILYISSYIMNI